MISGNRHLEEANPASADAPKGLPFRFYLIWLVTPTLVLYFLGFLIVRVHGYERWGGSSWGPSLDYAFQTSGENADVVIFGDSSALLAVDPLEMSRRMNLKVINLPNTIGSLPVIGDMALKQYLRTNRPPRLIIFYFCPWDLDYARMTGTRIFEGEEMLARHGSWKEIAVFSLHHPGELLNFPFRVFSSWSPASTLAWLRTSKKSPEVVAFRGHVTNTLPFPALNKDCSLPAADLAIERSASVRQLMGRYTTPVTGTLLYFAPVPNCAHVDRLLSAVKTYFQSPPPAVFPPTDFTADSYFAHLEPQAVAPATRLLGDIAQTWFLTNKKEVTRLP
jgi:hypothetical protein